MCLQLAGTQRVQEFLLTQDVTAFLCLFLFKYFAGLSATFEVGGASAGVGGEIDYFLIGILHKMY